MPRYKPDTIDDVHLALRGLSHRMNVEIEPGVPLAANTVAVFGPVHLATRPAVDSPRRPQSCRERRKGRASKVTKPPLHAAVV